jgi:hypothetical protein
MGRSKPAAALPLDKPSDGTSLDQIAPFDLLPTSLATPPAPANAISPHSLSLLQQFFARLDQWDREKGTGTS